MIYVYYKWFSLLIEIKGANSINGLASMNLFTRFPEYMDSCLAGHGVSGIIGDLLNIMSIAIFQNDIIKSTLLYFIIACLFILVTIGVLIVLVKTDFFK